VPIGLVYIKPRAVHPMTIAGRIKRLVVGRPLRSGQLGETLLPKWLALPVFSSDPLSSVAYATEEIVLVMATGGAAYLALSKWVAAVIVVLLIVVIASYRQTCHAYPSGGGAFAVSLDNFGENAALTAAAALLVDYVMTVAVSVVAGVVGITSAVPSLHRHAVALSVGFTLLLILANLRGVREAGRAFAIPTYLFVSLTFVMFVVGTVKGLTGSLADAATAHQNLQRTAQVGGLFTLLLVLRAFASGCTALTGVEAISNGVPSFRKPKARNAANTLAIMGLLSISMFVGITVLALHLKARAQPSGNPSVISQIAAVVFGPHAFLFYLYQAATAGILILAANTAFNGFPVLSSILAEHRFLPRLLHSRGDKLVFSNGIVLLGAFAIALIVGFDANIDKLIQLYIIGVFTSFTLSQAGMVRYWGRTIPASPPGKRPRMRISRLINLVGAASTAVVLVIVLYTKVVHGAWIAILAMAVIFAMMKTIRAHYRSVAAELDLTDTARSALPSRNHAIILVSQLNLPVMRAISYARATRPNTLEALTVQVDMNEAERLRKQWADHDIEVPLVILESPYREINRPLIDYIRELHKQSPRDVVTVFIPEFVVDSWWAHLLHNQTALLLKGRLLFEPGVMVTSVPWQLQSSDRPRRPLTHDLRPFAPGGPQPTSRPHRGAERPSPPTVDKVPVPGPGDPPG
jgi:amino acid transporter